MSQATQSATTPALALELLEAGNRRFTSHRMAERDLLQQVADTAHGQWPFAAILSCIDSRVPPELIFDQGVGDLFSARVAGNFFNNALGPNHDVNAAVLGIE